MTSINLDLRGDREPRQYSTTNAPQTASASSEATPRSLMTNRIESTTFTVASNMGGLTPSSSSALQSTNTAATATGNPRHGLHTTSVPARNNSEGPDDGVVGGSGMRRVVGAGGQQQQRGAPRHNSIRGPLVDGEDDESYVNNNNFGIASGGEGGTDNHTTEDGSTTTGRRRRRRRVQIAGVVDADGNPIGDAVGGGVGVGANGGFASAGEGTTNDGSEYYDEGEDDNDFEGDYYYPAMMGGGGGGPNGGGGGGTAAGMLSGQPMMMIPGNGAYYNPNQQDDDEDEEDDLVRGGGAGGVMMMGAMGGIGQVGADEYTPDSFVVEHAIRATRPAAWMTRRRLARQQRHAAQGGGGAGTIRTPPKAFPSRSKARVTGGVQLFCIALSMAALYVEESPIPIVLLIPAFCISLVVQWHALHDLRIACEDKTLHPPRRDDGGDEDGTAVTDDYYNSYNGNSNTANGTTYYSGDGRESHQEDRYSGVTGGGDTVAYNYTSNNGRGADASTQQTQQQQQAANNLTNTNNYNNGINNAITADLGTVWQYRLRRYINTRHMSFMMIATACFYAPICTFYCGFPLFMLLFGDTSSIGGRSDGEVKWSDGTAVLQLVRVFVFASVPVSSIVLARYYVLLKDEWFHFCEGRQAALWRLALVTIRDLQRRVIDIEAVEFADAEDDDAEDGIVEEGEEYQDDDDYEGEEDEEGVEGSDGRRSDGTDDSPLGFSFSRQQRRAQQTAAGAGNAAITSSAADATTANGAAYSPRDGNASPNDDGNEDVDEDGYYNEDEDDEEEPCDDGTLSRTGTFLLRRIRQHKRFERQQLRRAQRRAAFFIDIWSICAANRLPIAAVVAHPTWGPQGLPPADDAPRTTAAAAAPAGDGNGSDGQQQEQQHHASHEQPTNTADEANGSPSTVALNIVVADAEDDALPTADGGAFDNPHPNDEYDDDAVEMQEQGGTAATGNATAATATVIIVDGATGTTSNSIAPPPPPQPAAVAANAPLNHSSSSAGSSSAAVPPTGGGGGVALVVATSPTSATVASTIATTHLLSPNRSHHNTSSDAPATPGARQASLPPPSGPAAEGLWVLSNTVIIGGTPNGGLSTSTPPVISLPPQHRSAPQPAAAPAITNTPAVPPPAPAAAVTTPPPDESNQPPPPPSNTVYAIEANGAHIMRVSDGIPVGEYIYSRMVHMYAGADTLVNTLMIDGPDAVVGGEGSSSESEYEDDGGAIAFESGNHHNNNTSANSEHGGGAGNRSPREVSQNYSRHNNTTEDGGSRQEGSVRRGPVNSFGGTRGSGINQSNRYAAREMLGTAGGSGGRLGQGGSFNRPASPLLGNNNDGGERGGGNGLTESEGRRRNANMQGSRGPMALLATLFTSVLQSQIDEEREANAAEGYGPAGDAGKQQEQQNYYSDGHKDARNTNINNNALFTNDGPLGSSPDQNQSIIVHHDYASAYMDADGNLATAAAPAALYDPTTAANTNMGRADALLPDAVGPVGALAAGGAAGHFRNWEVTEGTEGDTTEDGSSAFHGGGAALRAFGVPPAANANAGRRPSVPAGGRNHYTTAPTNHPSAAASAMPMPPRVFFTTTTDDAMTTPSPTFTAHGTPPTVFAQSSTTLTATATSSTTPPAATNGLLPPPLQQQQHQHQHRYLRAPEDAHITTDGHLVAIRTSISNKHVQNHPQAYDRERHFRTIALKKGLPPQLLFAPLSTGDVGCGQNSSGTSFSAPPSTATTPSAAAGSGGGGGAVGASFPQQQRSSLVGATVSAAGGGGASLALMGCGFAMTDDVFTVSNTHDGSGGSATTPSAPEASIPTMSSASPTTSSAQQHLQYNTRQFPSNSSQQPHHATAAGAAAGVTASSSATGAAAVVAAASESFNNATRAFSFVGGGSSTAASSRVGGGMGARTDTHHRFSHTDTNTNNNSHYGNNAAFESSGMSNSGMAPAFPPHVVGSQRGSGVVALVGASSVNMHNHPAAMMIAGNPTAATLMAAYHNSSANGMTRGSPTINNTNNGSTYVPGSILAGASSSGLGQVSSSTHSNPRLQMAAIAAQGTNGLTSSNTNNGAVTSGSTLANPIGIGSSSPSAGSPTSPLAHQSSTAASLWQSRMQVQIGTIANLTNITAAAAVAVAADEDGQATFNAIRRLVSTRAVAAVLSSQQSFSSRRMATERQRRNINASSGRRGGAGAATTPTAAGGNGANNNASAANDAAAGGGYTSDYTSPTLPHSRSASYIDGSTAPNSRSVSRTASSVVAYPISGRRAVGLTSPQYTTVVSPATQQHVLPTVVHHHQQQQQGRSNTAAAASHHQQFSSGATGGGMLDFASVQNLQSMGSDGPPTDANSVLLHASRHGVGHRSPAVAAAGNAYRQITHVEGAAAGPGSMSRAFGISAALTTTDDGGCGADEDSVLIDMPNALGSYTDATDRAGGVFIGSGGGGEGGAVNASAVGITAAEGAAPNSSSSSTNKVAGVSSSTMIGSNTPVGGTIFNLPPQPATVVGVPPLGGGEGGLSSEGGGPITVLPSIDIITTTSNSAPAAVSSSSAGVGSSGSPLLPLGGRATTATTNGATAASSLGLGISISPTNPRLMPGAHGPLADSHFSYPSQSTPRGEGGEDEEDRPAEDTRSETATADGRGGEGLRAPPTADVSTVSLLPAAAVTSRPAVIATTSNHQGTQQQRAPVRRGPRPNYAAMLVKELPADRFFRDRRVGAYYY